MSKSDMLESSNFSGNHRHVLITPPSPSMMKMRIKLEKENTSVVRDVASSLESPMSPTPLLHDHEEEEQHDYNDRATLLDRRRLFMPSIDLDEDMEEHVLKKELQDYEEDGSTPVNYRVQDDEDDEDEDDDGMPTCDASVDDEQKRAQLLQAMEEKFTQACMKDFGPNTNSKSFTRRRQEEYVNGLLQIPLYNESNTLAGGRLCQRLEDVGEELPKHLKGYALGSEEKPCLTREEWLQHLDSGTMHCLWTLRTFSSSQCNTGKYRRVIPIEDFFFFLSNLHKRPDGKGGTYGQKKLFNLLKDVYAGVPRDAVDKFVAGWRESALFHSHKHKHLVATDGIGSVGPSTDPNSTGPQDVLHCVQGSTEGNLLPVNEAVPSVGTHYSGVSMVPMARFTDSLKEFCFSSSLINGGSLKRPPPSSVSFGVEENNDDEDSLDDLDSSSVAKRAKISTSVVTEDSLNGKHSEEDTRDVLSAHNLFVRRVVDLTLDRTLPLSGQPQDRLRTVEEILRREFPTLEVTRHRTKIGNYLKSCRKSLAKYKDKVYVRPTPPHTYSSKARQLARDVFDRNRIVIESMRISEAPLDAENEEDSLPQYVRPSVDTSVMGVDLQPAPTSNNSSSSSYQHVEDPFRDTSRVPLTNRVEPNLPTDSPQTVRRTVLSGMNYGPETGLYTTHKRQPPAQPIRPGGAGGGGGGNNIFNHLFSSMLGATPILTHEDALGSEGTFRNHGVDVQFQQLLQTLNPPPPSSFKPDFLQPEDITATVGGDRVSEMLLQMLAQRRVSANGTLSSDSNHPPPPPPPPPQPHHLTFPPPADTAPHLQTSSTRSGHDFLHLVDSVFYRQVAENREKALEDLQKLCAAAQVVEHMVSKLSHALVCTDPALFPGDYITAPSSECTAPGVHLMRQLGMLQRASNDRDVLANLLQRSSQRPPPGSTATASNRTLISSSHRTATVNNSPPPTSVHKSHHNLGYLG